MTLKRTPQKGPKKFVDNAEEHGKKRAKVKASYRRLRNHMNGMVKSMAKNLFRQAFLRKTGSIRVEYVRTSQQADQIHNAIHTFVAKHANWLIRFEIPKLTKKIERGEIDYAEARKEMVKKFQSFRQAYAAYLNMISMLLQTNSQEIKKRKGQIDVKSFTRNFDKVLALLNMPRGMVDIVQISNIAEQSRKGKLKNRLFTILNEYTRNSGDITASDFRFLGKKFYEFIYGKLPGNIIGKYEKFTLPILLNNASYKMRFAIVREALKHAKDGSEAVFIMEYFVRGNYITNTQALALIEYSQKKYPTTKKIEDFQRKILRGEYAVDRNNARKFAERRFMLASYPYKKQNFGKSFISFRNIILYEFVFHGFALGAALGAIHGAFYAIKNKDISYLTAVLTNQRFLASVGIAGAALEAITGPEHRPFGEGAVSKTLHNLGKGGLEKRFKKKVDERLLGDYLTNKPRLGYLFVQNYEKVNETILKGMKKEGISYNKKLYPKHLKKILPQEKIEAALGYKFGRKIDNKTAVALFMFWRTARVKLGLKTKDEVATIYRSTIESQGIGFRSHNQRMDVITRRNKNQKKRAVKLARHVTHISRGALSNNRKRT